MKMLMPDNYFKLLEIVKLASTGKYSIVVSENTTALPFNTEYTLKELNISKWWPLNKIQLWAIKKAFKNLKP